LCINTRTTYLNINLSKYCKDQDIEVNALKLKSTVLNICIIAVYRAPCGNFNSFLIALDSIINPLYKVKLKIFISGVINVDYLINNDKKETLMICYCPKFIGYSTFSHQSPESI
jgi:hypothetical protein